MTQKKINSDPFALKLMRLMFKIFTPIVPGIMNRYAYNLWITPTHMAPPERERPFIEKANASFVLVDGLKIRIWSWGEGPTVLFIHGWGGRGTQISFFIDPLNEAGFKVMSVDLPAHGQSDGKKTNAFQVSQSITEVIKRIDNLHTVITHSFAGIVFGYYYYPALCVKNIVMICPPSTLHTAFNEFSKTLALPQSTQNYLKKELKQNFGNDVFEKFSLIENAKKITCPTLIVHDEQDETVPWQDGKDVANALKKGTFYETHELGHRKVLYDKTVIDYVINFIKQKDNAN